MAGITKRGRYQKARCNKWYKWEGEGYVLLNLGYFNKAWDVEKMNLSFATDFNSNKNHYDKNKTEKKDKKIGKTTKSVYAHI